MPRVVGALSAGILLVGLLTVLAAGGGTGRPVSSLPVVVAAPVQQLTPVAAVVGSAQGAVPVVSPSWVAATSTASGIPQPAMRAYGAATIEVGRSDPGCHLGWTTLAGIGWVESQHGTIGGRTLGNDGRPDRPVFGPLLDGRGRLAAIRSSSGGWQRAVGPLQFLRSTWSTWGADGDGDGRADPQDLDDAALAAARYLCAAGQDLATGAGWTAAVLSYNHADAYVRAVYDAATTYAGRTGSVRR